MIDVETGWSAFDSDTGEPAEAKVYYDIDWPWEGKPWPWCYGAEQREAPQDNPRAEVKDWVVVREAIPHHGHSVNMGNVRCPGVPGIVPPISEEKARARLDKALARVERAQEDVNRAARDLDITQRDLAALKKSLAGVFKHP